jgi:transcriptional/translational regulatory protein YebC/TACO1
MAGHSHWANIARKKAIIDNKRGKVWSKLAKNIMAAAKAGGGDRVGWMFERKGLFVISADKIDEDELLELALEAGADDVKQVEDKFEVTCDPAKFSDVAAALEAKNLETERREIARIPTNTVDLDAESGRKVLKLMEKLDEHDDVQTVASNFNIPEAAMAEIGEG